MFEKLEILQLASGAARHATSRQSVIARNIANSDTPGYKARDIVNFASSIRQNSPSFTPRATRPEHAFNGSMKGWEPRITESISSKPNGNSVSIESEMVKAVDTRQRHQMAISTYKTTLDIIRSTLGRR